MGFMISENNSEASDVSAWWCQLVLKIKGVPLISCESFPVSFATGVTLWKPHCDNDVQSHWPHDYDILYIILRNDADAPVQENKI